MSGAGAGVGVGQWGGRREGAGPKVGARPRVRHRTRVAFDGRFPALVSLRLLPWMPSLRRPDVLDLWRRRIAPRECFQVLDWTLQTDHLHFIAEAPDGDAFERGMTGLSSSFARGLNRWVRFDRGRVFDHRYHRRSLESEEALDRAIRYVHTNWKKHGEAARECADLDPFASQREHPAIMKRARTELGRRVAARMACVTQ